MPSVSNLFQSGGARWMPDADKVNAPEGSLLRADNLTPDSAGALSLRRGSSVVYSSLGTNVHTLYTAELENGTTYRIAGVDDSIFINGASQATSIAGSGDLAVGDDAYQAFLARGTTKKKWDGTTLNNWGIAKPAAAPTLTAIASITSTIADFNNSESPAVTLPEGSGSAGNASDQNGAANEATTLTPDSTSYRGVLQRLWTTDQDFLDVGGVDGTETDLVDFYVKFGDPRNVEKVKVVFGLDDSSTAPFKDNRFEFEFNLKDGIEIPLKDLDSEGYGAYQEAVLKSLSSVNPSDVTSVQTPEQVKTGLANVGDKPSPKSQGPPDSGVWGHLTVTRGQFERIGNEAGRGWDTVRGFKIVYTTVKGKTSTLTISDAIFVGGGNRALTGTYRCVIRAVRQFEDSSGDIRYYELSPPSAQSDPINLNHQNLQITIPNSTRIGLDPQVDQIWVYLFGGWLDAYYRFAVVPATPSQGMSIDELESPQGSDLNTVSERSRIPSWGFTYCQLNSGGTPSGTAVEDLVISLRTSELDALTENERLEPYQMQPPDNIIDIAGPWRGRIFVLTSEGFVYPSSQRSPGSYNSIQLIDLTRFGDPLWIAQSVSGIYVGCEKDIVFLAGTANDSVDLAQIDLYPQPLGVANPPIDKMHWREGNSIIYRSADGPYMLTGTSVQPVPFAGTSLLWRGQDRHGISALNVASGRFRCAVDNRMLYMLAPEGSSNTSTNVIWRYAFDLQQWSRFVFPQAGNFLAIYNEPDGTLVASDDGGKVWKLEDGEQDDASDIRVTLLTAIEDGGNPLGRKDAFDLQLHMITDSDTATITLYKDGNDTETSTYTGSTSQYQVWRANASDFGTFLKAQMQITGNFSQFRLHKYDLTYRVRPQHSYFLDTGYYIGPEPTDLVWMQEVEVDSIAEADLTMKLYFDDTLWYTTDISVTPSIRTVYRVPLPRGSKGLRPRIELYTTAANQAGENGFECYSVRVRSVATGNEDKDRGYIKMWPAGEAP